ncbi:hypothetical protein ABBQ38_003635 [Trebouxia sp. C0009 RCD-2024]
MRESPESQHALQVDFITSVSDAANGASSSASDVWAVTWTESSAWLVHQESHEHQLVHDEGITPDKLFCEAAERKRGVSSRIKAIIGQEGQADAFKGSPAAMTPLLWNRLGPFKWVTFQRHWADELIIPVLLECDPLEGTQPRP